MLLRDCALHPYKRQQHPLRPAGLAVACLGAVMNEQSSRSLLALAPAGTPTAGARDLSLRPAVEIPHTYDGALRGHDRILRHGPLELHVDCCQLTVDGDPVDATAHQLRLLEHFMRRPGRVCAREQLLRVLCGIYANERAPDGINCHVCRLRKLLGPAGQLIETVRGFGYRLRSV